MIRPTHYSRVPSRGDLDDLNIPRFTWWDHRGSDEWLEMSLGNGQKLSSLEVYWFDDTGSGACRVPANWRLLYRQGGQWKAIETSDPFGVKKDQFNKVSFAAVSTDALRLEVKTSTRVLRRGFADSRAVTAGAKYSRTRRNTCTPRKTTGAVIVLGNSVILSAAKNLAGIMEILRCAQNDRFTRISCRTPRRRVVGNDLQESEPRGKLSCRFDSRLNARFGRECLIKTRFAVVGGIMADEAPDPSSLVGGRFTTTHWSLVLAAAGAGCRPGRRSPSFARSIGIRFTPSSAGRVTVRTMPRI